MRYTVRYFNNITIVNDLQTNKFDKVLERIHELKKLYRDVWYADAIEEILVG